MPDVPVARFSLPSLAARSGGHVQIAAYAMGRAARALWESRFRRPIASLRRPAGPASLRFPGGFLSRLRGLAAALAVLGFGARTVADAFRVVGVFGTETHVGAFGAKRVP